MWLVQLFRINNDELFTPRSLLWLVSLLPLSSLSVRPLRHGFQRVEASSREEARKREEALQRERERDRLRQDKVSKT